MSLSPLAIVAIGKVLKGDDVKEASKKLTVGEHTIDETFRIKGTLKKGEDTYQTQHMRCDVWAVLAVALSKVNTATMESIIKEALTAPAKMVRDIKERAEGIIERYKVSKQSEKPTTGRVDTNLVVDTAADFATETQVVKAAKKPVKKPTKKVKSD